MRVVSTPRGFALLASCLALASCTSLVAEGTPGAGSRIAPEFADWLEAYGPAAELGDSLTPARTAGGLVRQTFVGAELVYDPGAPTESAVTLTPLGLSLGLAEPPTPPPGDPAARYFPTTGHTVYTGFLEAYGRLGGEAIVGAPISEVRFEEGLIYQYFENLGFYREETASPSEVHLIAFGLASLGGQASRTVENALLPPGLRERPFAAFLDRYGGEAFFGRALSDPYTTADGNLEQVYERAVFWSPLGEPEQARLRSLGLGLGPAEPPVEPSTEPGAIYVPATGHNIPSAFSSAYEARGGEDVFGLPLEETHAEGNLLSQRFENGVLEYHDDLPSPLAVQLAPLGIRYTPPVVAESQEGSSGAIPTTVPQMEGPVARTWVDHPMLEPGFEQQVHIEVVRPDGTPWSGVIPLVRVAAPHGAFYPSVPATGPDGRCSFALQLEDLRPGEIITYEVVVTGDYGTAYAIGQFAARLAPQDR